jgi:hypothetical protein
MVDKFMEFVHAQTAMAEEDTQEAMSVEREKTRWLDHLEVLRKFVDGALAAYAEAGIKMSTKMVTVTEEQTGPYKAPQVEITVGPAVVKLKPIGTFLIGAFGRVDMEGSRGVVRLILVPAKAQSPLFGFNTDPVPPSESELVWKIMPPPPSGGYVELTKEVFLEMLMKVVRGG